MQKIRDIFIIGSKGIPAQYGGYETFVDQLTAHNKNKNLRFHVACMAVRGGDTPLYGEAGDGARQKVEWGGVLNEGDVVYNGARCFNVTVPNIGSARAVYYDILALKECIRYIRENKIQNAVVYILACRIGPFVGRYKRQLEKLGAKLYLNPDGHEWLRSKWSAPVKKYWKTSERLMVKRADLVICDSVNIEKYILETYAKYQPKTTFIAYGADMEPSAVKNDDKKLVEFFEKNGVKAREYYLIVGRFVPENNYETMIREFMKSGTKKDLVIITGVNGSGFFEHLKEKLQFEKDERIKFVGTVYDKDLLKKIREEAYGYLHGHSVGGTNPSLIEALAATDLNLLCDVSFNHEVAEDGALYWGLGEGELADLLDRCEGMPKAEIAQFARRSTERVRGEYTWEKICGEYDEIFQREV